MLSFFLWTINVTDSMNVGRTTSMPKSALRYELDKARYLDLDTCSIPVLFSQNLIVLWAHFDSWRHLKKAHYLAKCNSSRCATVQYKFEVVQLFRWSQKWKSIKCTVMDRMASSQCRNYLIRSKVGEPNGFRLNFEWSCKVVPKISSMQTRSKGLEGRKMNFLHV